MWTEHPEADYLLFRIDDSLAFKASFQHDPERRALFTEKRDVATVDAGRDGVSVVAKCLVDAVAGYKDASTFKLSRDGVIRQLTEEYEVDVRSRLEKLEGDLAASGEVDRYAGMTVTPLWETKANMVD